MQATWLIAGTVLVCRPWVILDNLNNVIYKGDHPYLSSVRMGAFKKDQQYGGTFHVVIS